MTTKNELLSAGAANVTLKIEIDASVSSTWRAMIEDVGKWWRADFLVCERSQGMRLEPYIGGKLFEDLGDGAGFVWGNVTSFQPNKHLAYVAQIVPPWGGPAQSVVQIALAAGEKNSEGSTELTLTDSLIGHVTDDLMTCLDDGWQQLYGEGGLKSYVEAL